MKKKRLTQTQKTIIITSSIVAVALSGAITLLCLKPHNCEKNYRLADIVEATCSAEGVETYKCKVCDKTKEVPLPKTEHTYFLASSTKANCTSGGFDTYKCAVCLESYDEPTDAALGHNYQKTTESNPTCTTSGGITYTCARCDDVNFVETAPAIGHNYKKTKDVAANCTERGERAFLCLNCNDTYSEYDRPLQHDYTLSSVEQATCTKDGMNKYVCSRCKAANIEITEKFGHDFVETSVTAATCTANGNVSYECVRCNQEKRETTEPLGHDLHIGAILEATTCGMPASVKHICIREGCTHNYTERIDALPHDYKLIDTVSPTCSKDGAKNYLCSRCSGSYSEPIPALGHDLTPHKTILPTCENDGADVSLCQRCQETIADPIPALGHDYLETKRHEAGCVVDGIIEYVCLRCEETSSETIKAIGSHDYILVEEIPSSCTEEGEKKYKCSRERCIYTYTEVLPKALHVQKNNATIYNDSVCANCGTVLQAKLDYELNINYNYGFATDYREMQVNSQDRTIHNLGEYDYYSTPTPITPVTFNGSISLQDFYTHNLLTARKVETTDGKHFYVDGGFKVNFKFQNLSNELVENGGKDIMKFSDFAEQFEDDSILKIVKKTKTDDKYYNIYEVVDFAHSTIEISKLVDGVYTPVATINSSDSWNSVLSLDSILLSDTNGKMFSTAGTYRVMFKFNVAWFIDASNKIYDSNGVQCYPYGILNDQYDYFYVTVRDDSYNVLLPDDIDETRDMFYQISMDDLNVSLPFIKSGEKVTVNDDIDFIFDSKIGYWNNIAHYQGKSLTSWTMDYSIYDSASDSYVAKSSHDLLKELSENGTGTIGIPKSSNTGYIKIDVKYTMKDVTTGEETAYVDVYFLGID